MIVVDTNILAYFWLPGTHSEIAERLWRIELIWSAPLLWRSEFRNVLAGYMRRGVMTRAMAVDILSKTEAQLQGNEFSVAHEDVMRLVDASPCSAYDCEFVALATSLSVPLITTDKQVLANFPKIALHPDDAVKSLG